MSDEQRDFEEFMKRREAAAGAYVNGDATPLSGIVTRGLPATFFGPKGDYKQGASEVSTTYTNDAGAFDTGSENRLEILQMAASYGIAYWTGFQRALVRMKGKSDPVPFNLRITEIFRHEGGEWKMVHRHADMLKE